jgi:hypothetical protein
MNQSFLKFGCPLQAILNSMVLLYINSTTTIKKSMYFSFFFINLYKTYGKLIENLYKTWNQIIFRVTITGSATLL